MGLSDDPKVAAKQEGNLVPGAGKWKPGEAPHLVHGERTRRPQRSPEWSPAVQEACRDLEERVGPELRADSGELHAWAAPSVEAVAIQRVAAWRTDRWVADREARGTLRGEDLDLASKVGERYHRALEREALTLRSRLEGSHPKLRPGPALGRAIRREDRRVSGFAPAGPGHAQGGRTEAFLRGALSGRPPATGCVVADLARARDDLGAFAEMVGRGLAPFQLRALTDPAAVVAVVAPRQSGKSRSLALYATWRAFRAPGAHVLLVSASEEASRRLLRTVRELVAGSPLLAGSVTDEMAGLLTLTNGSEVRSVPASERAIRGWSATDLLLDEAALLPEPIFAAATPTIAARPGGRIIMASSATTAAGPYYDYVTAGEAGSEHVRTHRWGLADATWLTPSFIAAQRESMSEVRFRAEFEGIFASGADALFTPAGLDSVTADYHPETLATLRGPARVLGGLDWGQTHDRSALVVIARLPIPGDRLFAVCLAHRWPAGYPLTGREGRPGVVEQIAASPAHFQALVAESNGLGGPLAGANGGLLWQHLARRDPESGGAPPRPRFRLLHDGIPPDWADLEAEQKPRPRHGFTTAKVAFTTTGEGKAAGYSALRLLVDQGRLLLPMASEELRRELLMLRVDLSPTGVERVEAGRGHDDLADALMLSTWPQRKHGGWTTALGALADPERPLPDPDLPRDPARDVVLTGDGREVPRRPAWVSVAGREATVPDQANDTDPEAKREIGFHGRLADRHT